MPSLLDAGSAVKQRALNAVHGRYVELRGGRITRSGVDLDLSSPVVSRRIKAAVSRGLYERGEIELLNRHLSSEHDLVELGGGIGFVAAYADRLLDDDRTHVVVEADERLVPLIERTRSLNGSGYRVENRAYAPDEDAVELFLHEDFWSNSAQRESQTSTTVPAISLDELIKAHGIETFSLVVDIEGGEVSLLDEIPLLEERCHTLIVEFHDTKTENEALAAEIRDVRRALDDSALRLVESDRTKSVYTSENRHG